MRHSKSTTSVTWSLPHVALGEPCGKAEAGGGCSALTACKPLPDPSAGVYHMKSTVPMQAVWQVV